MANNDNLIDIRSRTPSEQREIQSRGGKASGKARRKKADLRRIAREVLSMETTTVIEGTHITTDYATAIVISLIRRATNETDNRSIEAAKTVISLVGDDKQEENKLNRAKTELIRARTALLKGNGDVSDGNGRLDELIQAIKNL